jgi:tetratricopeptide (TPR) repeat protein
MEDYYQQGVTKARAGDHAGALEDFEMALIATPSSHTVYYRRGLVYFDLGDNLAAVSDYTKSIDLQPQQKDAYYARALIRLILKNFTGALTDIDKAIMFARDYAPAYQLKGNICQKLAQRQEAIQAYKLAASLYLKQQDKENSRICLTKAEELAPRYGADHPFLTTAISTYSYTGAIAKAESGDLWGALQEAEGAVRSNPHDAKAYCCRGVIQMMRSQNQAAIADFNQAIRLDPQGHTAYRHRGKMRQEMGDPLGAIADYGKALELNEQDWQLYGFRAKAYASVGNYSAALADLHRSVEIDPQNPVAYLERAAMLAKTEELTAAQEDYQTAANLFLERHDLENYQAALAKLQSLQQVRPPTPIGTTPPSGGNRDLRQYLLKLVGGQWPMAERLIERFKEEYPGYDEDWYLEQTIAYIERGM